MENAHLIELIDDHRVASGISDAELAREIGISRQQLSLWRGKGIKALPTTGTLAGIAHATGVSYATVLEAALLDAGYQAAPTKKPKSKVHRISIEVTDLTDQAAARLFHALITVAGAQGTLRNYQLSSLVRDIKAAKASADYDYRSARSPRPIKLDPAR